MASTCNADGTACACQHPIANKTLGPIQVDLSAGDDKYVCQCGQSKKFPFCDGSHVAYNKANGTKVAPLKVNKAEKGESVWVCRCGHSKKRPFCDGSHKKVQDLPAEEDKKEDVAAALNKIRPQLVESLSALVRDRPNEPYQYLAKFFASKATAFVINGFYMSMREKYTKAGAQILFSVVEWGPQTSWADFRSKVLGATDPKTANAGSLRETVLQRWKEFGLTSEPNVGDNGVHGSASPFEAMCERLNWLGAELKDDQFGVQLLNAGIPAATILAWTKDPQVQYNGQTRSLFDSLEDTNTDVCLQRLCSIAGVPVPAKITDTNNQAFVFIKPHAAVAAVDQYVQQALAKAGFKVKAKGALDNKTIEDKKLIDNHYYAIANKASLTLPRDLNPPQKAQEEFKAKWGLTWEKAIADGLVYNAVDGCKRLNIDGDQMDALWAKTKKADQLIKFGGGFYCGKVQ